MAMTVRYNVDLSDLEIGNREASRVMRRWRAWRRWYEGYWEKGAVLLGAWIVFGVLAALELKGCGSMRLEAFWSGVVILGGGSVLVASYTHYSQLIRRKRSPELLRAYEDCLGAHLLSIDESGMHHSQQTQRHWFDWDLLEEVVQTPSFVALGLRTGQAFFVPLTCLESVGGASAFINEIERLRLETREVRRQRWLATHDGRCEQCGYSLRGLMAAQCPECGWVVELSRVVRE